MDSTRAAPRHAALAGERHAAPAASRSADVDLDRLVWDPEYREALRPWLRQAGEA